ncbi:cell death-inducing p53-target protein 1 homolog [Asterias rubens]|uniref:cell death-inducing p53-target protein 1 homolog n=1 Tax=Asterias rubens TaxID=7604 RepID=UPI0014556F3A|nr:cell death-inducing p53-target protein 1 homolog [Asterias rubens]
MSEYKDPAYPPEQPTAPYAQDVNPQGYPQPPGYAPQAYAQQDQGYPPQQGYGHQGYTPQQGYPQQQPRGYPQQQPQGHPQQQPQGYATQTYVPQAVYTPQGQVTIKTGAPQHTAMVRTTQVEPNDYLCFSIFVMLLCCLPFGIIALIKSMDVRSLVAVRDFNAAARASKSAKNWNVAGLVSGLMIYIFTVIIMIIWFVVFANAVSDITDDFTFDYV